jgi:hypothetical protein
LSILESTAAGGGGGVDGIVCSSLWQFLFRVFFGLRLFGLFLLVFGLFGVAVNRRGCVAALAGRLALAENRGDADFLSDVVVIPVFVAVAPRLATPAIFHLAPALGPGDFLPLEAHSRLPVGGLVGPHFRGCRVVR